MHFKFPYKVPHLLNVVTRISQKRLALADEKLAELIKQFPEHEDYEKLRRDIQDVGFTREESWGLTYLFYTQLQEL